MWNPFKKKRSTAIRDPNTGKITGNAPANAPAPAPVSPSNKAVENEISNFSAVAKVMQQMQSLGMMPGGEESGAEGVLSGLDGWQGVAEAAMPYVGPFLPSILERLGFTASPPSGPPPEGQNAVIAPKEAPGATPDIVTWIYRAADAPQPMVTASVPLFMAELDRRGIDRVKFKEALSKLNKAIK